MAVTVTQINTLDFIPQTYETRETNLISSFDVNNNFSSQSYIEFFVYSLNKDILYTDFNFIDYTILNDGQSSLNNEFSSIYIEPSQSLIDAGFDVGEYNTYYNFLNKKVGSNLEQLYISEISNDRTEIRLDSNTLDELSLIEQTNKFIQERQESDYFVDFYLNFGDNNLILANNIALNLQDTTNSTLFIKLYEPLPDEFDLNSTLWIVTSFEDPIAYQITFEDEIFTPDDTIPIQGPNFNLDLKDQVNNSTIELSYTDLVTTSLTSSQQQLNSLLEEKEIDINVDYTNFSEFTHFSSVQTRLENFYSKIQLIEQYSSSIALLNNTVNSDISGSVLYYQSKIDNIITNFDGYDYFLYYESSSYAWPKTTSEKPYELAKSNTSQVLSWIGSTNEYNPYYGGLLLSASIYDNGNPNNLYYSIPEYLRDDPNNAQYELFVSMVGQFYDNIWIYYKDVTEKYNADNRLEYGISKDIVADAIRDFGIKLYQNNFSNNDLYTAFLGLTPEGGLFPFPNITGSLPTPSGFEYIDTFISASNDFIPLDDVNKSLYKRIYHNLPYLLKSKGTLPGLRALITSYGIPDTILRINEYGGKDKVDSNDWDYWQNEFNYALGHNPMSSNYGEGGNGALVFTNWELDHSWNSPNNVPATVMFRFKPFIPETKLISTGSASSSFPFLTYPSGNLLFQINELYYYSPSSSIVTLGPYTYSDSGSYSGSLYGTSSMNPYSTLTFYPEYDNLNTTSFGSSSSLYLPFYDGGWWSLMINRNGNTFNIYAGNKIYEGGDNGTKLGFFASSSIIASNNSWKTGSGAYPIIAMLVGYDLNPTGSGLFAGSVQELRYYNTQISESVFKDFIMNPSSIEGNSLNSAPNELAFRAPLGNELYYNAYSAINTSIHPKVTGSWAITQSFFPSHYFESSGSGYEVYGGGGYYPNREYFFYDQPIAGIRNTISDKIRIENNVLPEGNTLSPFMSLSQMANISQSYTQNINYLEVAFSPQNEINEDIMDQIGSFNIGEFIGDPRLRSSSAVTYPALDQLRNEYFQKYISNYNLTDFIRLIKFFDNSLFKMIRDFVPARTSLASGIVIKQHLLERNKYPQPQTNIDSTIAYYGSGSQNNLPFVFQNIEVSGTIAPQWNDYEPGTVENFEGQTGGVFDSFNSILNTSQSWYENITTPSGSVLMLHNSQDEFYNGEFSGSTIIVSNGILNEAYPIENLTFDYKHIHYNYFLPEAGDDTFTSLYLDKLTSPQNGEILFLSIKNTTSYPNFEGTKFLKISKIDCDGNDNNIPLSVLTNIYIKGVKDSSDNYREYKVSLINELPTYYSYEVIENNFFVNNSSSPNAPNQLFNYIVSSSITSSQTIFGESTFTINKIDPWDNILAGTNLAHYNNPYFNTSSGYFTLENTPNTPLQITASIVTSGSTAGRFQLILNRQGNYSLLDNQTYSSGANILSTVSSLYYGLQGDQVFLIAYKNGAQSSTLKSGSLLITQSRVPSTSSCYPVFFQPYITTPNFYNSDENALLNNAFELRDSSYYMDVDYSSGITEPVNFDQLISGSATRAKVQDSNYTSKRVTIPRYEGSKSTSQQLNKWTEGDSGTFGKLPTVENLKSYVAYGLMDGSWAPERMNASLFTIKYLIDQDGNITTPNISNISLPTVQQNFPSGDRFRYSSVLGLSLQGGFENQFRNIIKGGYRIEPILYTQSGSAPNAQWNTTMSFEDIVPSNQGAVGNYSALFGKTNTDSVYASNTEILIQFDTAVYGSSFLSPYPNNGYVVPLNAIIDGVNLTFNVDLEVGCFITSLATLSVIPAENYDVEILLYKNSTLIASTISQVPQSGHVYFNHTVNNSDLQVNDVYKIYFKYYNTKNGNSAPPLLRADVRPNSEYKITQYPSYTLPVTSSGVNTIWGYPNSGSYPYVITSSNSTLVELYNSNVKQSDITGSGFNPIVLPWSIKYGDEFRFEGREDFTYVVGKIFSPADSGSGRIFQTGSIEVHFNQNLPTSASSSVFNLDHFLIRRYVDDATSIIFEGFRPTNGGAPNSFIITPEYIIPQLNKSTDEYVKLLTEKGLIG